MSCHDFNIYTDIKDMRGYEAFIGPNGEFYRVKPMSRDFTGITHYSWAEEFLKDSIKVEEYIERTNLKTKLNFLIHVLGFIRYTHLYGMHGVYIDKPDVNISGRKITKEQLDTLFNVMTINGEKPLEDKQFLSIQETGGLSDVKLKL